MATYANYHGVQITVEKDNRAFADYPSDNTTKQLVDNQVTKSGNTTRQLLSDPKRYRVYYPKDSLSQLCADIEALKHHLDTLTP